MEELPERRATAEEQRAGAPLDRRLAEEDPHPPRPRRASQIFEDGDDGLRDREKDSVASLGESEDEDDPPATVDEAAGLSEAPPAEEEALREDDESQAPGLTGGRDGYVEE